MFFKLFKNSVYAFVYSNLWLAFCALIYLRFLQNTTYFIIPIEVYLIIILGVLCSYNLHWYFTNNFNYVNSRFNWNTKYKRYLAYILIISSLGILIVCIKNPFIIIPILPTVLLSINYSLPKLPLAISKRLIGKMKAKNVYLSIVWSYTLVVFPIIYSKQVWQYQHIIILFQTLIITYLMGLIFNFRNEVEIQNIIKNKKKWMLLYVLITIILNIVLLPLHIKLNAMNYILIATLLSGIVILNFTNKQKHSLWFYGLTDGILILPFLIQTSFFLLKYSI